MTEDKTTFSEGDTLSHHQASDHPESKTLSFENFESLADSSGLNQEEQNKGSQESLGFVPISTSSPKSEEGSIQFRESSSRSEDHQGSSGRSSVSFDPSATSSSRDEDDQKSETSDDFTENKPSWKRLAAKLTASLFYQSRYRNQIESSLIHSLEGRSGSFLVSVVKDLERAVRHLQVENIIFRKFLATNDLKAIEEEEASVMSQRSSVSSSRRMSMRKSSTSTSPSQSITSKKLSKTSILSEIPGTPIATISFRQSKEAAPKINLMQKMELLSKELEEIEWTCNEFRRKSNNAKSRIVAKIEEIETRKTDLNGQILALEQFREVTAHLTLEKFMKLMMNHLNKCRFVTNKLRLRLNTSKTQFQKLSHLLVEKKRIGENLTEIDFEQLNIANQHLEVKIQEKHLLLRELKKMTGEGNLQLSVQKGRLDKAMAQKEELVRELKTLKKEIGKYESDMNKVYDELEKVKAKYEKVKSFIDKYEAPDVVLYLKNKGRVDFLKRELKMWERRKKMNDVSFGIEIRDVRRILRGRKQVACD